VAIVNWLVQGCIVAALSAAVLRFLLDARAQARYTFCWGALAIVLTLPVITFMHMVAGPVATVAAISRPLISVPHDRWNWMVAITIVCGVWSVVSGWQFVTAIAALRRARRDCRACPSALESSLRHWTNVKERGRPARLMLSDDVRTAAVLSGRLPIIALAPSVVDHLAAEEIDLIVIHEWAHVQRRDDTAHFVQVICRIVAGWHPAVSWLNRRLHEECESACDEMAVAVTDSPKAYAASLLKLAALPRVQLAALPAVGALSSSELAVRVRRIISGRQFVSPRWSRNAVASSTIVLAAVSSTVAAVRIVETTAASPAAEQSVLATDVQRFVPARFESKRTGQIPPRAKPSAFAPGSQNAAPPPIVNSVEAGGGQLRAHRDAGTTPQAAESRDTSAPAPSPDAPPLSSTVAPISFEPLPIPQSSRLSAAAPPQTTLDAASVPPWTAAANAGRAVGQGSKNAGVATAGFFTRVSKRIAGSF
jgi:beta-lactamase regulating signal transducer with metallopeptidase domain